MRGDLKQRLYGFDESGLILPGRPQVIQQALFFGDGGGSGPGTPSTWSLVDYVGTIVWSNGDLTVQNTALPFGGVRGTVSKSSGKRYIEYYVDDFGSGTGQFGLGTASLTLGTNVTLNASAAVMHGPANNYGGGVGGPAFSPDLVNGAVVQYAIDFSNGKVWLGANGTWLAGGDPAAGTGQTYTVANFISTSIYPLYAFGWANLKITLRTTIPEFSYSVPSGFIAWGV